ncbi:hypothetical protein CRE_09532 [Caenorhabditis remanei]|uniref:Uncharacterized protein n=1 Tax=Caenorhabditis remanei TaxID=31234 RepID=E3MJ12_CAERE|nr:hypothetical protein CRE_09532 [Caenorhabditis remanei]
MLSRTVLWSLIVVIYYNERTGEKYNFNAADYYVRDNFENLMWCDLFTSFHVILACSMLCFSSTKCAKRYMIFFHIQIIMAISMTVYSYFPLITGVEAGAVNFHQKQFFTAHLRYTLYYPALLINYLVCTYFFRKAV